MNYGDSLTLAVTVTGNCNLDGYRRVMPGGLPGYTVYEALKAVTESVENNEYRVQKEFEAILTPNKNGLLEIASIPVSYFNPATGKYERTEIPGAQIEVLGEMPVTIGGTAGQAAEIATVLINQVSYAGPDDDHFTFRVQKDRLYAALIGLAAAIALCTAIMFVYGKRKKRDAGLKTHYRLLMAADDINDIYNRFNAMIKHRYNLSLKASSQNDIMIGLADPGVASRVADIMGNMESGGGDNSLIKNKIKDLYKIMAAQHVDQSP